RSNMASPSPISVFGAIRDGYLRYFDTAFWLRDAGIRAERRQLLESPGVIFISPLLEPVMPYEQGPSLTNACAKIGLSRIIADELGRMLFLADGAFRLREHQARSLEISLTRDPTRARNVVVTAGTGSGKTECFLLPIFARLLLEAAEWASEPPIYRW